MITTQELFLNSCVATEIKISISFYEFSSQLLQIKNYYLNSSQIFIQWYNGD